MAESEAESHFHQAFEEFWEILKRQTGYDLPKYIQIALKYNGFEDPFSIQLITNEEIDLLENFIKNKVKIFIKPGENHFDYYYKFHDKIDQFQIPLGHRIKLLDIARFTKDKLSTKDGIQFFTSSGNKKRRNNNEQCEIACSNLGADKGAESLFLEASNNKSLDCDHLTKQICDWMKSNAAQLYLKFSNGFSSEMVEVNITITCPMCKEKIRTNSKLIKFKSHVEYHHVASLLPAPPLHKLRKLDNNQAEQSVNTTSNENTIASNDNDVQTPNAQQTAQFIDEMDDSSAATMKPSPEQQLLHQRPPMPRIIARAPLKIVDSTFRYTVKNVSKLRSSVISPPCFVRNLLWRIMVMPRMNVRNGSDNPFLGFFLQCNAESNSSSWSCNAKAELSLLSFKSGHNAFVRKIKHLFCEKYYSGGFSSFKCWNEILDPNNGYVQDDCIVLEVLVVADEPRGVCRDQYQSSMVKVTFVDNTNLNDLGFSLNMSRSMTYGQMASKVGHKINVDPSEIQFFISQKYKDLPGPAMYSPYDGRVKDLLAHNECEFEKKIFYQLVRLDLFIYHRLRLDLFHQRLTTNITECENEKQIKCLWLSINMKVEKELIFYPNKHGTVRSLLNEAVKQIELNKKKGSGQLRILEVYGHILLPGPSEDDSLKNLTNQKIYRIEEIPHDEINLPENELLISVSHFHEFVYNKFPRNPFFIKIKQGERFAVVKERLQQKLDVTDKEWQYRFAIISMGRAEYIADDDLINLADFKPSPTETRLALRPFLGFEHCEINPNTHRKES